MKVANTPLTNFLIEFDQSVDGGGPTQDFIDKHGQGIQHLGVSVAGPLDAPMNTLEQHGGRWTLGLTRNGWVFLDLMQTLGMTIDLTNLPVPSPATTANVLAGGLAKYPVAHVTFLSAHADATAKAFADVFGVAPSAARVEKPVYYPPGSTANANAYLKTVELKNAGMTVVVAEPVGSPSPAADFVAKHGGLGNETNRFVQVSTFNMRAPDRSPAEICSTQVCSTQVGVVEFRSLEVDFTQAGTGEVRLPNSWSLRPAGPSRPASFR